MPALYWGTVSGRYANGPQPAAIRKGFEQAEVFAMAWLDQQLVGVATMSDLPELEPQEAKEVQELVRHTRSRQRSGSLDLLLVHTAFRNLHIATRLWECLLAHSRTLKLKEVRAEIVSKFLRKDNPKNPLRDFKGKGNHRVLQLHYPDSNSDSDSAPAPVPDPEVELKRKNPKRRRLRRVSGLDSEDNSDSEDRSPKRRQTGDPGSDYSVDYANSYGSESEPEPEPDPDVADHRDAGDECGEGDDSESEVEGER